jgi:alkanesulfonate monooxygenase
VLGAAKNKQPRIKSRNGRAFAAAHAEVVFTAQTDIDDAIAFRADMHRRLAGVGRNPTDIRIMPGLNPVLGKTRAEAEAKRAHLSSLIPVTLGLEILAPIVSEVDLSQCDSDRPIPLELLPNSTNASQSGLASLRRETEEGQTIRQIYTRYANARGQNSVCGTASDTADHKQHWFEAGAVDGFLIQPMTLPEGLEQFADEVIPILQERGLFRDSYTGGTLRENLGLARPVSSYTLRGEVNAPTKI